MYSLSASKHAKIILVAIVTQSDNGKGMCMLRILDASEGLRPRIEPKCFSQDGTGELVNLYEIK